MRLAVALLLFDLVVPHARPQTQAGAPAPRFVEIPEDTPLEVLTDRPLRTERAAHDIPATFTLAEDVMVQGAVVIPRGVTLHGNIVRSKPSGRLSGSPELVLELTSIELEGRTYPLYTYQFQVTGASKTPQTTVLTANGAFYGAIAGSVGAARTGASTAKQTLADVGAGAAAGTALTAAVSAASGRTVVDIPAESQLTFALAAPIVIVPLSAEAVDRIRKQHPLPAPVLYVRGQIP